MKMKSALSILASIALAAALVIAGFVTTEGSPPHPSEPNPPPGYRVDGVGYDLQGNPCYSYVRVDYDPGPPIEVNEEGIRAGDVYHDQLMTRLQTSTPYKYWRLAVHWVGRPEAAPPLTIDNVFVHVYVSRPEIVTAMQAVLKVVWDYDPQVPLVGFIFHEPTSMYGEANVYLSDFPGIDWQAVGRDFAAKGSVRLGESGHLCLY